MYTVTHAHVRGAVGTVLGAVEVSDLRLIKFYFPSVHPTHSGGEAHMHARRVCLVTLSLS